jgi:hypothetical protein
MPPATHGAVAAPATYRMLLLLSKDRKVKPFGIVLAMSTAFGLSACGTYVPDLQDFSSGVGYSSSLPYVIDITHSVSCEVRDAVYSLYHSEYPHEDIAFLDDWGAQVDLTLAVNENGSVAPATQFFPIGQPKNWMFNWGVNANVNTSATRTDTVSFFYTIKELAKAKCAWRPTNGGMLIQSDLKFRDWLYDVVGIKKVGLTPAPTGGEASVFSSIQKQSNVLSHTVTFVLTTSGGISPQWVLRNASFIHVPLSISRMKTDTMLITLGPTASASTADGKKGTTKQLAPTALNIAQSQNTAIFITNIINNNNNFGN